MIYNKLSGTTVDINKKLLFREFESENCYLGFARRDSTWGSSALIGIEFIPPTSLSNFITKDKITNTNKSDRIVGIYKSVDGGELQVIYSNIILEYVNDSWCLVKSLPSDYKNSIYLSNGVSYYISFTSNGIVHKAKIRVKDIPSGLVEPTFLYTNNNNDARILLPNLSRRISVNGEIEYYGLVDSLFTGSATEASLIELSQNANTYFYFTNSYSLAVTERLYLKTNFLNNVESIFFYDANNGKYLLFKGTNSSQPFYIKLSYNDSIIDFEIYNENTPFPYPLVDFGNNVSDTNPPALTKDYITLSSLEQSIFEVESYIKIKKNATVDGYTSQISYVKEIKEEEQSNWITNNLFNTSTKRIESIIVNTTEESYKFTNSRPKPDGKLYTTSDRIVYLWSNVFLKNDQISIDSNVYTIIYVNNDNSSITLDKNLITVIVAKDNEAIYENASQIKTIIATNVNNIAYYAVCDNFDDGMKYGMDSIMITMNIPKSAPALYDGLYRQLFVSINPYVFESNVKTNCTDNFYSNHDVETLYDTTTHKYDVGTIVYLSNKNPVYRKYIKDNTNEYFKIVI